MVYRLDYVAITGLGKGELNPRAVWLLALSGFSVQKAGLLFVFRVFQNVAGCFPRVYWLLSG